MVRAIALSDHWRWVSTPRWSRASRKVTSTCQRWTNQRTICKGSCAAAWPPLKLKSGQRLTAGGVAKQKLLGSDKNPGGGRVVTYNRWPLYTYIADSKPGQAIGQALKLNGGYWYVLSPAGKVITKKP